MVFHGGPRPSTSSTRLPPEFSDKATALEIQPRLLRRRGLRPHEGSLNDDLGRDARISPANGAGLPLRDKGRISPAPTRPTALLVVAPPVSYAREKRASGRHARLALQPLMNFPMCRWRGKFMRRGFASRGALPIIRPAVPTYHRQTAGGSPLRAPNRASIPRPMGRPCPPASVGSPHLPVESGDSDASDFIQTP
jgi:hypothetical protein